MGRRLPLSAVVVCAALTGTGLLVAGACTLYSNGESNGGTDGGATIEPSDAALVDTTAPPQDSGGEDVALPSLDSGPKDSGPDSCAPIETSCLDGIDNDCNGLTDCADPACTAGYACVAPAAGGWTGYALYDDTRASPCPASYPTQADTFEGLLFSPATCSTCGCVAGGATCGASDITCEDDGGTCTASGAAAALGASCAALAAGIVADGRTMCAASTPVASGGSCTASGGDASLSAVSFSKLSRTCGATSGPGGGCSGGGVCVAKPPTGTHGVCVTQAVSGSALCPGGYSHAFVVVPTATSYDDTRGCTSCQCSGPSGATCSATATLFTSTDCSSGGSFGTSAPLPADGICQTLATSATTFASGSLQSTVTSQGSCNASGGAATGTVTPKNQTAYCCQN